MCMTIEEIYNRRWQIRQYDESSPPEKKLIVDLVNKTFDLTPSKQNLMPYRVHILGPEQEKHKKDFWQISKTKPGGQHNYNIFAPYLFMFCMRKVTNPNKKVRAGLKVGVEYTCTTDNYENAKINACLEMGMFSTILTGLALEQKLAVSYLLCFPDAKRDAKEYKGILSFLQGDYPLFVMGLGYPYNMKKNNPSHKWKAAGEDKPEQNEVVNWV